MPEKIERSNCRFSVQKSADGKSVLVVSLYQDTIPALKDKTIGFDLLGGLPLATAQKLAETMNEHVLDIFVAEQIEK